jgi:hypothetical protein
MKPRERRTHPFLRILFIDVADLWFRILRPRLLGGFR